MNTALFILILAVAGIEISLFTTAVVTYKRMFVRHGKPGIPRVPDSFEGDAVAMPGIDKDISAHVHDPVIMKPLLDAKRRWQSNPIEKITCVGKGGTFLSADFWKISDNVAVIVHGMTDSSSGMAYLAEEYVKKGWSVLAVNMRAHGESQGKLFGLSRLDAEDLICWLDLICERIEKPRFVLHGVSMGASTVVQCMCHSKFYKKGYDKLTFCTVSDCGFSSFRKVIRAQIAAVMKAKGFMKLISEGTQLNMSLISFVCGRHFWSNISPEKALKRRSALAKKHDGRIVPLVVFHGTIDLMVKPFMAEQIAKAAGESAELHFVEDAPHIGSYFYGPEVYMEKIFRFIP